MPAENIFVLHDDIELPFGYYTLKKGGGAAGHNGLRSIIKSLGTSDFFRIRLGISRPGCEKVASYVLGRFSGEEEAELHDFTAATADFLITCIKATGAGKAKLSNKKHWSER